MNYFLLNYLQKSNLLNLEIYNQKGFGNTPTYAEILIELLYYLADTTFTPKTTK